MRKDPVETMRKDDTHDDYHIASRAPPTEAMAIDCQELQNIHLYQVPMLVTILLKTCSSTARISANIMLMP